MMKYFFILAVTLISCTRSAKITLTDQTGHSISYIEDTYSLGGKGKGDIIPIAVIQKGEEIKYISPLKVLFAKKGQKFPDGSIYLGNKKFIIQSITFELYETE